VWKERFEDADSAALGLKEHKQLRAQLTGAVEFSLRARKRKLDREGNVDPWLALSFADYGFVVAKPNARQLFREALSHLDPFAVQVARRQVEIFASLGLLSKSVEAVVPLFGAQAAPAAAVKAPKVLLFTGHRIDDPNRPSPRFPARLEPVARQAIADAVKAEMPKDGSPAVAIAGGASGGDLLFHEICEELGIERRLYLIIPRDAYVAASVAPSGPGWVSRFNHQYETAHPREYQQSAELPVWLQSKPQYGVWQRSNIWMLHNALAVGGIDTTLIALWDGKGGDGPGGTQHMVESAQARGARTIILDTKQLFGL